MNACLYRDLLEVFKSSKDSTSEKLALEICKCNIPQVLQEALCLAVMGDNRDLNHWMFTEGTTPGQCIAWIAPVVSIDKKYVWMMGEQNSTSAIVHNWFLSARGSFGSDPRLLQTSFTPDLLFVDTYYTSVDTARAFGYDEEFAIFQVGYKDATVEVTDLEQRMVINTKFAVSKRFSAITRMAKVSSIDPDVFSLLNAKLELFALIHNEGHNQGHFVGTWPFEEHIKKNCVHYEAVEEFRACLASVVMSQHLPLSDLEKEAYAVSVFATRFFGFGFEAFCLDHQRRETVREISVGLMFFEWLLKCQAIEFIKNSLFIDPKKVRHALLLAYDAINTQEDSMSRSSADELKLAAKVWYQLAFPNSQYSQTTKIVYDGLR